MKFDHQKWALLSFKGRMRRKDYWFYNIPVLLMVLPTVFYQGGNIALDLLTSVLSWFAIYACVALNIKRLQDRNRSPWFVILTILPLIGPLYSLVELGILDGTPGNNRFGADPKARHMKKIEKTKPQEKAKIFEA